MNVKLLAYTPDPERLVAAAAKNCYSSTNVDSILDGLIKEAIEKELLRDGQVFYLNNRVEGIEDLANKVKSYC